MRNHITEGFLAVPDSVRAGSALTEPSVKREFRVIKNRNQNLRTAENLIRNPLTKIALEPKVHSINISWHSVNQ